MTFVTPDMDVMLKPLIHTFQIFCLYPQSINTRFSSTIFLARFLEFFTPYKVTNDQFSFSFPYQVRKFFIN